MKLEERERLILMAAQMHGRSPDEAAERMTANCGKVLAQALVWAGLWTNQMRRDMPGGNEYEDSTVQDWYDTLIAMTQVASDEALLEGRGNLGSPDGDRAAAPTFTACRVTIRGRALAQEFFMEYPQLTSQPKEFFRGL